jgi:hypothetical protein
VSVLLAFGFNHDAASAVEDLKLQKPSLDPIGVVQLQVRDREFQGVCSYQNESVELVLIMFSPVKMAMGRPFDLPYSVELWDDNDSHVEELIALTGDYRVAKVAFDEAVKRRPGRIVTLRHKTRLLADSRRKN